MNLREYRRRSIIPLVGLVLAGYFLFVFVPLSKKAEGLEQPVRSAWRKLAASLDQTNAVALNFARMTNQLDETRQALRELERARERVNARLEPASELRSRLAAPEFRLYEYQNERSKQMDALEREAKQQQITLDPAVLDGFPEYTFDVQEPALLWAALSFTDDLMETAVRCKPAAIHSLEVPVSLTNSPYSESLPVWAEIPLQMEFTAAAENALRILQSLPLKAAEIQAAGLPAAPPGKAPLLIDRVILRKQNPEKLDEVRVWFRAVGFVRRQ